MQATSEVQQAVDRRRLHDRLKAFAMERAALDAREARCLVIAEEVEIWKAFGYTTMFAYLEAELGYGPHTASERLRVAHALRELPLMSQRLEVGEIHHSTVRELTRVATYETEKDWLDAADGKNLRQVERLVSGHRMGDLPDDEPDPAIELRKRTIEVTDATWAVYRQARRYLDEQTGERLTEDVALAMICRGTLAGDARTGDAGTGDAGTGEAGAGGAWTDDKPSAQVAFTVCPACARATQDGAGMEADIDSATLARVLCDAEILGDPSESVPRTTATVTPRVRRQVLARDHHRCAVPGCRHTRFVEIHHVRFQSHGGRHEISNLVTLCTAHHTLLHTNKLVIRGIAPDLNFFRITDDGAEIPITDRVPPSHAGATSPDSTSPDHAATFAACKSHAGPM